MNTQSLRILFVQSRLNEQLAHFLRDNYAYTVDMAVSYEQAWDLLGSSLLFPYHVVLTEEEIPRFLGEPPQPLGLELLRGIKIYYAQTGVILFRGEGREHVLDAALEAGASSCLPPSVDWKELAVFIRHAAKYQKLQDAAHAEATRAKQILNRLLETGSAWLGLQSQKEVLKSILQGMKGIGFDRMRLYLRSRDGQYMQGVAHIGMNDEFLEVRRPIAGDPSIATLLALSRPHIGRRAEREKIPLEDLLDKEDVDEWLCLPLLRQGQIIGMLVADNKDSRRPIRREEVELVGLFASQAAAAIEQVRWAEQMAALQLTTLNITSCTDHKELLTLIIQEAVRLLNAANGGLYKYYPNRKEKQLEIIARYKRPMHLDTNVNIAEGLVGQLLLPDSPDSLQTEDHDQSSYKIPRFFVDDNSRSMIGVRLKWQEKVIGVLYVNDVKGRKFDSHEVKLLQMFADHAAIALNNYDLAQQNERKLQKLAKLSQATTEIMGTLGSSSLDEQLTLVAKHAVEILDAERCRVFIVTRPGWLSAHASYGDVEGSFNYGEEYPIRSQYRGGLTSHIAYTGEIFQQHGKELEDNPYSDGVLPKFLHSYRRRSLLGIPLKHEGKLIALLRVENKKDPEGYADPTVSFLDEDVSIANVFAEQVVTAIQKADLVRQQALLLQTSATVSNASNPSEGLQRLTELMPVLFDHTFCRVLIMDARGKALQTKTASMHPQGGEQSSWSPDINVPHKIDEWEIWAKVLSKEEPTVLSQNKKIQKDILDRLTALLQLSTPVHWLLMIPLKTEREVIGLLQLGDIRSGEQYGFTQEQKTLLATVATQITSLVELLRVQEIAEHQKKTTTAIAGMTAQENRNVIQAIVRGTQEAVKCDAVTLYEYDALTDQLSYPPVVVGVRFPEKLSQFPDIAPHPLLHQMLFQDQPYCVENITEDALFKNACFAQVEAIESCVAIPLKAAEQRVGLMFVNYRRQQKFTDELVGNLKLFADHAAVAIRNTQLYQRTQKHQRVFDALHKAGQAMDHSMDLVLEQIAEQAWIATNDRGSYSGFADIWLIDQQKVNLKTVYPRENFERTRRVVAFLNETESTIEHDINLGIIGRTIRTGKPQFVYDVARDDDYYKVHEETCSECTMPIIVGNEELVGVINVEFFYHKKLDAEDKRALEVLAGHASRIIQNARHDEELRRARALVTARTALAWMGLASSTALHTISNKTANIVDWVELLRRDLNKNASRASIEKRLDAIVEAAENIRQTPITALSSAGTDVALVPITALVRERLTQLWQREPYKSVELRYASMPIGSFFVRANAEWLKKALTIPIDNAVRAMDESLIKILTVKTCICEQTVEIHLSDTGPGIPEDIRSCLFQAAVPKSKGMGMGLLMAQTIVQAYEGTIEVGMTDPRGTTIIIRLPLAELPGESLCKLVF